MIHSTSSDLARCQILECNAARKQMVGPPMDYDILKFLFALDSIFWVTASDCLVVCLVFVANPHHVYSCCF